MVVCISVFFKLYSLHGTTVIFLVSSLSITNLCLELCDGKNIMYISLSFKENADFSIQNVFDD